jgi:hypothetical protein
MSAKFKDISCCLLSSLLYISGATREHLWMNRCVITHMGTHNRSEMAAVLDTLSTIPRSNGNQ